MHLCWAVSKPLSLTSDVYIFYNCPPLFMFTMKSKQTYKILTESQAQGFFEALHFLKTIFCFYAMHLLLKDKTVLTISRSVALELALLPHAHFCSVFNYL